MLDKELTTISEIYAMSKNFLGYEKLKGSELYSLTGHSFTDSKRLLIMLPKGSSNSAGSGRTDMASFLTLGQACPIGYAPDESNYFPWFPGASGIRCLVGRPQDMSFHAACGNIDGFIAFGDVVEEAEEAGLKEIESVVELSFASVDLVLVVKQEAQVSNIEELISYVSLPVRCVTESPFLARRAFWEEPAYCTRFGDIPPVIEIHGRKIVWGCESVQITASAGSCEPLVSEGFFHCAVVVKSTGETIRQCGLKVIKTVGSYRPALFCRAGLRDDPALAEKLNWFIRRLRIAEKRWLELNEKSQLELPLSPEQ